MYVCEESHCGIVPMKHSNNDGISSAESAEGRLQLKENALSPDMYPTQCGTAHVPWVGERADRRQACMLGVIHPREEPDALMSARPGPSGGYHASDIPTGISLSPKRPNDLGKSKENRLQKGFGCVKPSW